jgi:Flp pilus assembly protein TadG
LIEFTMLVPVFLMLLTGLLEFGMVFAHHLTLEYGTREGARAGAALGDGSGDATVCSTIDPQIIAAVERVIAAPGSPITVAEVSQISIWQSDANGAPVAGQVNVWSYTGPGTGPLVDGAKLRFTETSNTWSPCTRVRGPRGDSIGVSLSYRYQMITPLSSVMGFFGGPGATSLRMDDATIMALHP